jgi:hypothetical protein
MASGRRTSAAKEASPPADLAEQVRNSVRDKPGLTAAALKKHLPVSHQKFATPALLNALAENGEVVAFMKGKTALFFATEPLAEIERQLPAGFAATAVESDALKAKVAEAAPGHEVVLDVWLKRALSRRVLFEHAPARPKGKKRYGSRPDLSTGLKSVLKALQTALKKFDAQGISRDQVAEALLGELGVSPGAVRVPESKEASAPGPSAPEPSGTEPSPRVPAPNAEAPNDGRSQFVTALKALSEERPREALLSVRELRPRTSLAKEQFDRIALELAREGFISLHHHDHAAALPESERVQLIEDARGTYFNGIAPRRGHV